MTSENDSSDLRNTPDLNEPESDSFNIFTHQLDKRHRWAPLNIFNFLGKLNRWQRIFLGSIAVASLIGFAFIAGARARDGSGSSAVANFETEILLGRVALSESELRSVVERNRLTAYWSGPVNGSKFSIFQPKSDVIIIRYLPKGKGLKDALPKYRVIVTYGNRPGSFDAIRAASKKPENVGFINIDGNAVFYVRTRPTNVYMAIQGKDTQIEIFDPGADQAVALSLFRGQISRIK